MAAFDTNAVPALGRESSAFDDDGDVGGDLGSDEENDVPAIGSMGGIAH